MFFDTKKVIGLDIGTSSIKLAELEVSRKGAVLTGFGFVATPVGSISAGEIMDPSALSRAIQSLVLEVKTKRKHVATGVWGAAVIVKKISMPRMNPKVLSEQIRWEAEQYIPFEMNSINLDYHILKKNSEGLDSMEVLLIAAQKDFVFRYAESVESAGLNCAIVDVSAFAVANTFQFNYGEDFPATVGLLDFGAGVCNFVVIHKGEVIFSRDVLIGGQAFTNEIHKQLGVSLDEAEGMKISASSGKDVPQEVISIMQTLTESMVDELQRAFDFFQATIADASIQKFYISGGGMGAYGLVETFSRQVQIPCELFNPFVNISYSSKVFSSEYIAQITHYAPVALGLALRKVGDR
ncbi:MAG: fimbrial assembly protein [Bdellovibrionales bacterium CG10_big_fil_rev_8_21_14_0_10_45_34]|nr:MAG: fimbrial assembly protein [Bdellovibrionales bacterium CG10_big_fil_rev_8_21_14_0_10_45_34]